VNQPLPDLSDPQEKLKVIVEIASLAEADPSKRIRCNSTTVGQRLDFLRAALNPAPPPRA